MLKADGKRFVGVTWLDAHGAGVTAYSEHEIPHRGVRITTYGWELREDAEGVSIVNEVCADGTYRGYTFIPASLVLTVDVLPLGRKSRSKPGPRKGGDVTVDKLPSKDPQ